MEDTLNEQIRNCKEARRAAVLGESLEEKMQCLNTAFGIIPHFLSRRQNQSEVTLKMGSCSVEFSGGTRQWIGL